MGSQIVNSLLGCLPENTTAWVGEAVPVVTQVASAAIGALSELFYLQIGGAGGLFLAAGAGYFSYRYLDARDVQARALLLIRDDMCEVEKSFILYVIRQIPFGEREDLIRRASPLIWDNMGGVYKGSILESIRQIPSGERDDVIERVLPLMRANMDGLDYLLKAIRKIPSGERDDVIERGLRLMQVHMNGMDKTHILNAIEVIPSGQRDDVIERALPLMRDNMDGLNKADILNAIRRVPSEERDNVIDRALPLIRDVVTGSGKGGILTTIREIPPEERDDVIDRASLLITNDMDGIEKSQILKAIREIPSGERGDVIDRALPLMQDLFSGLGKGFILRAIGEIPSGERDDVIRLALPLMRDNVVGGLKASILDAIRTLPLAERNLRTARALEQIQIDFPGGEFDHVIIYFDRICQLLETPLDQAFLPMGQNNAMAAAAAAGHVEINVHAGNRDARVKAALLLLRKSQSMTEQEINSSADKCIQYLKEGGQSRALWVLKGPNNPNDFGPFFKEIIINGESTSGREVIGRLWGFIQALPESEKQLALDSLVTGLNHCVNENGERICDPGKMQHLFIAVLQGRLPEVEVDDSIKIPKIERGESSSSASSRKVPVEDAMRLFFENPKHREIVEFEELLEAAKAFYLENPLVNREEFIQEMKSYAERQGIDSKGKEEE